VRVLVTTDSRFVKDPAGNIYSEVNPYIDYRFWARYLDVFSAVFVSGRVRQIDYVPDIPRANGENIEFISLPVWNSTWEILIRQVAIKKILRGALKDCAICLRAPTVVSVFAYDLLKHTSQPYGVEIVGDPRDALSGKSWSNLPWFAARWKSYFDLKHICRDAAATAYVTEETLQRRYPPRPNTYTTHFSSIILEDDAFATEHRTAFRAPFRLVHVGTMPSALYKGQDVLLRAFKIVREQFPQDVTLTLIGDGEKRVELGRLTSRLQLDRSVRFTGLLTEQEAVRSELSKADLFVFPSRQEGLPKALVEAMALGLPAIGTKVGGIPELISKECLIPPDDHVALANKIITLIQDESRMAHLSAQNMQRALDYHIEKIRMHRNEYYREVLEVSKKWQQNRLK